MQLSLIYYFYTIRKIWWIILIILLVCSQGISIVTASIFNNSTLEHEQYSYEKILNHINEIRPEKIPDPDLSEILERDYKNFTNFSSNTNFSPIKRDRKDPTIQNRTKSSNILLSSDEINTSVGSIILKPLVYGGYGYTCSCFADPEDPEKCAVDSLISYSIYLPGSYILGEGFNSYFSGISIDASDVILDGNDKKITAKTGIEIDKNTSNVVVKNFGSINGGYGIISEGKNNKILNNNVYPEICGLMSRAENDSIFYNFFEGMYNYGILSGGNNASISRNKLIAGFTYPIYSGGNDSTISENTVSGGWDFSIRSSGAHAKIFGNTVTNSTYNGIVSSGPNSLISDNILHDNSNYETNFAINVFGSNSIVDNNTIYNSDYGIVITDYYGGTIVSNVSVIANNVFDNFNGISDGGVKTSIKNNKIKNNEVGTNVGFNSTLQNNNITRNNFYGIYGGYHDGDSINIIGNNISDNRNCGLYINGGFPNIVGNNITGNEKSGIFLDGITDGLIYNNYFGNEVNTDIFSNNDLSNWTNPAGPLPGTNIMGGPYIAGNYWSIPKGKGWSDLQPPNPKGYTTTPYEVSLGVYDTAPLVKVNTSSHIIEASAGDGGKIEPSGSVYVEHGENVTFTFIPDKSYQTANFTIDGKFANNTSPFTFTKVKTDHTIEANFSKTPVVLVHGFNSDPSCWTEMIKRLNKEGIETWAFDYSDNNRGDPRVIAHQFKAFIENKRDEIHYYGPIDIICHSMGALVSRWEMENLENGDANVRQWIGIAPVTGGSALADDEDGLFIFRAILNLIGIFDPGSALTQLSTNSETVKELNNNINKNQLNKNTIYRVIVGYNPDASIFFNNLLFAVTRQKINDAYSWTFLGDGIVANTQSYFHNVGEQFDTLPIMGIYWDHEEASSYNHQKICHQQETINHVVGYYQNPLKSSTNILPNEPTGVKPNLIIKTWETAKITANAYTVFRFPVIGATLLTICCTGDGNYDINSLKDSNLLSEKVNITITYKSGKSIKLTPGTAYYQSDSNNLTCFIDPDEVGEYTVTVSPIGLQPYGFNGEMKLNGITSNDLIPINEIIPSSGINSESATITNLSGNNFHSGAIVNLSRSGYSNITATNVQYPSSTKITCTIPITGASPGLWNVTVMNPDGQMGTLINGFTITKTGTLNPVHAGSIVDGQGGAKLFGPHGVFVKDNYAYVVSSSNALEIIDISIPENPVHTGSIVNGTNGALLDNPYNVFISEIYAYVISTGSNALEIIDVSNPTNPVHKGYIKDGEGGAKLNEPYSVYVSGNNAYVASKGSNALEIVNISNPEKPVHSSSITDGEEGAKLNGAFSVFVSGNYAYVASSSSNALEIIDVSNPANPVHKGCISDGEGGARINNPQYVFVSNNYAYVVSSGSNALEIIDIKNPANPIHKGSISDGEGGSLLYNPISVYIFGNYAHIASPFSDALEIIDIFDPENPVHAGSIVNGTRGALLDKPWSVAVSRNYAYVASYSSNALEVVNIGTASPIITSITPSSGVNGNPINIRNLEGSGFQTGALVKLSRTGNSEIIANTVSVNSPSHITCTLPITDAAPGLWNVTVTNLDGQMGTLINGFTITNVNPTPTVTPTPTTAGFYINSTSDKWTISYPSGNKTYPEESNQTFITQSKPGAELLDVIVDEQSKGANKSYTFTNITTDHSIQTVGDANPHQVHVMFNATPCTGKLPLRVEFFDESLGEPTMWYWQFGDGQTSSFRNPIHKYTRPGIYSVSLRAYNNNSGGTSMMNEMIRVIE